MRRSVSIDLFQLSAFALAIYALVAGSFGALAVAVVLTMCNAKMTWRF